MIKWYDAKEVHPARNCDVVVMVEGTSHKLTSVIDIRYEDGYFNGKEHAFKEVVCWAYETDFEDVFNTFKEEDDF